ncbi:MAG: phenylacetic acid degradation protein PaaY [Sulfuritalea sp.]|nr:phenylacetic acid degradation protein PaaY [Sulfuritalea sp.]
MSDLTVYSFDGVVPVVHPSAYVHPTAVLIGDVIIGAGVYVGPCACMRGDFGRVILEEGANLQDTCVMHGFPGTATVVGPHGHIGHGAVLHGCRIERDALVGMNAVVMDNAVIGEAAFVAASAFVKANELIPPRVLVAGVPAKIIRSLSQEEIERKLTGTRTYQELARRSIATLVPTKPLSEVGLSRQRIQADTNLV